MFENVIEWMRARQYHEACYKLRGMQGRLYNGVCHGAIELVTTPGVLPEACDGCPHWRLGGSTEHQSPQCAAPAEASIVCVNTQEDSGETGAEYKDCKKLIEKYRARFESYQEKAHIPCDGGFREDKPMLFAATVAKACLDELVKLPAADVAPVVRGKPRTETRTVQTEGYHEEMGVRAEDGATLYRKTMVHVDVPYEYCPACGATLCSHWNNYCGKCGAKMDRGDGDE